jgi:hypothetical protein
MPTLRKLISGGQTGADQAALRAAVDLGLDHGGWCPPDRASEAGPIPAEFDLQPTPQDRSPDAPHIPRSQRTEWNVRDADATLIVRPAHLEAADPGTDWAIRCAARYDKPQLVIDPADPAAATALQEWLAAHAVKTLSIGGPSESTAPGIGARTYAFLIKVLAN